MFTLPKLPYDYADLEPFYEKRTLEVHHLKHHQTYTDKLNAAVEAAGLQGKTVEEILTSLDSVPEDKRSALRNHGGGFWNHTFFWESMAPNMDKTITQPKREMEQMINKNFGSFEQFKEKFNTKAANHFGSGWAWLVLNQQGNIEITDTHDQVCPISLGHTPLLTIDVWEHAYYLQYQNKRPEWIDAFWYLVNWEEVENRLLISRQ